MSELLKNLTGAIIRICPLPPYPYLLSAFSYPKYPLFQRTFVPLKVAGCNASGSWSFSDATIDVSSVSYGDPEAFVFRGAVHKLLKSRELQNTLTSDQEEALEVLWSYLKTGKKN
jgi:hypothetical protein